MIPARAATLLVAAGLVVACGGDRPRPGPPAIQLEMPPGNVVTSPDTFVVWVYASDDNGLDSLIISFLDQIRDIPVFNEIDVVDGVLFAVPAGYNVGELLEVTGMARDLVGGRTVVQATVTVATDAPQAR